jgi:hypothetical protein
MTKRIVKVVWNSANLFCVVSFLSFFFSFLNNHLNQRQGNLRVGFPLNFYYQFELRNNCNGLELQHGTTPNNFILNYLICLIIAILFSFRHLIYNRKQQTQQQ